MSEVAVGDEQIGWPESGYGKASFSGPHRHLTTDRIRLSPYKRNQVAFQQSWCCYRCRDLLRASFHIDHIVPLRFGGKHIWENFGAMCANCHNDKSSEESERAADRKREDRTGISKYFAPASKYFLPTPSNPPPYITRRRQQIPQQAHRQAAAKSLSQHNDFYAAIPTKPNSTVNPSHTTADSCTTANKAPLLGVPKGIE
jgi:hypothetical protein